MQFSQEPLSNAVLRLPNLAGGPPHRPSPPRSWLRFETIWQSIIAEITMTL